MSRFRGLGDFRDGAEGLARSVMHIDHGGFMLRENQGLDLNSRHLGQEKTGSAYVSCLEVAPLVPRVGNSSKVVVALLVSRFRL